MSDIRTAGDLRNFLIETMQEVRTGKLDTTKAHAISKLAAQINQSIATEVSAAIKFEKLGGGGGKAGALIVASGKSEETLPAPQAPALENLRSDQDVWCEQCDGLVKVSEARRCKSKFCKAGA